MQTPRVTRSSVLGKRAHLPEQSSSPLSSCDQLQTPDSTPTHKRLRTSSTVIDGDGNKENVPPFQLPQLPSPVSSRSLRALRRNSTEDVISPTRNRGAPSKRTASTSDVIPPVTPATAIAQLSLSTPPPTPPTLIPIHARARALLRPTCNDINSLSGRDSERQIISEFVTSFVIDSAKGNASPCLYISGPPGSGKTALVSSVLHSLDQQLGETKVIMVNCMALSDVDALWQRILDDLENTRKRKGTKKQQKGKGCIEDVLSQLMTKCVLILDEIDHIVSAAQSLTSLFTLLTSSSGFIRVIGIANTHTLGASSTASSSTISQVSTLHFAPYTPVQLQQILQSRLAPLYEAESSAEAVKKLLPNPTLMLLTKKIAAITGDVRCLFEVLRGAIDLAVSSKSKAEDDDVLSAPAHTVTPAHVLSALKAYAPSTTGSTPSTQRTSSSSNSEIVSKIRTLGLQARLVLLAVMLAFKRLEVGLGLSSVTSSSVSCSPVKRSNSASNLNTDASLDQGQLHSFYSTILSRGESGLCAPVTRNEFGDLINMLESIGLVAVGLPLCASPTKLGRRTLGRSTSFGGASGLKKGAAARASAGELRLGAGVWSDEVLRGLGVYDGAEAGVIIEEELRVMWNREMARVGKDLKTLELKSRKNATGPVGFMDASED